jgi:hypothetical protein
MHSRLGLLLGRPQPASCSRSVVCLLRPLPCRAAAVASRCRQQQQGYASASASGGTTSVLFKLSGNDQLGVVSNFSRVLAEEGAQVLDVDQSACATKPPLAALLAPVSPPRLLALRPSRSQPDQRTLAAGTAPFAYYRRVQLYGPLELHPQHPGEDRHLGPRHFLHDRARAGAAGEPRGGRRAAHCAARGRLAGARVITCRALPRMHAWQHTQGEGHGGATVEGEEAWRGCGVWRSH